LLGYQMKWQQCTYLLAVGSGNQRSRRISSKLQMGRKIIISDPKLARKSFGAVLRGWLIRVGLVAPPHEDDVEEPGTRQQVRKARTWLQFHRHNPPRYRH